MIRLAALGVFALLVLLGTNWLQTTTYEVQSSGLPSSFDGFCIVQISDLHIHNRGKHETHLLNLTRKARPDLIAITGDLTFLGSWHPGDIRQLARELRDIAPVYFVSGNHEALSRNLPGLLSELENSGVQVLDHRAVRIERATDTITVAGVPDPQFFHRQEKKDNATDQWRAALAEVRDTLQEDQYTVLLSHRPEHITDYARLGFDLVLSGHAHGGQIRLPIVGALYAPDQGWLPRYTSGMHVRDRTTMIVSRGLGKSLLPIRVFNRLELVVVRLKRHPS